MLRIVAISLLFIAALFGAKEWLLWTENPRGFSDHRFKQIPVGTPVEKVFEQIGFPFEFTVFSLRPGGSWDPPVDWYAPLRYTEVKDVTPFLSNTNRRVLLDYARPGRRGGSFRARQIVISGGKVVSVDAYNFWDEFWN